MLDLGELAESAVRSDAADKVRRRLAEWGIDPSAAVRTASDATPAGAAVVGGLVNLRIDGARADLLILETGLFVVPGLPRGRAGVAKQRLAAIAAADDPTRAHAAAGGRFLPYADVTTAARVARVPRTWRLTRRDGAAMLVRAGLDSDELPGGWTALADAVAFLARARRV
jgi:hypothetical protein